MISPSETTKLLLHFDGIDGDTSFFDSSISNHNITRVGNIQLESDEKKFGNTSCYFPNEHTYLSIPHSTDFNFGGNDFTIDFWVNFAENVTWLRRDFVLKTSSSSIWWRFVKDSDNRLRFTSWYNELYATLEFYTTNTWIPTPGQWYHLALVRNGSNIYIFIDGISQAVTVSSLGNVLDTTQPLTIGGWNINNYSLYGYLDELRIVNGEAIWTSNFIPPTEDYEIPATIESDLQLEYDAGYFVDNDINVSYDFLASLYIDLNILANIGNIVYTDLQLLNNLFNYVYNYLRLPFFINNAITNDIENIFHIGQHVNNDCEFVHDSIAYVTKDLNLLFNNDDKLSCDLELKNDIGLFVLNDIEFVHDSIAYVTKDLNLEYFIGQVISSDCSMLYKTIAYVTKDLQISYGLMWGVYSQIRTVNNVTNFIKNDLNVLFGVYSTINKDINLLYNIFSYLYNNIIFSYNISSILATCALELTLKVPEIEKLNLVLDRQLLKNFVERQEHKLNLVSQNHIRFLTLPGIKKINIVR